MGSHMDSKAWPTGQYICCGGDVKCANNKLMRLVDWVFHIEDRHGRDKAKDMLYNIISDRDETIEWYEFNKYHKEKSDAKKTSDS